MTLLLGKIGHMRHILRLSALWELVRFILVAGVVCISAQISFDIPLILLLFWVSCMYIPVGTYLLYLSFQHDTPNPETLAFVWFIKGTLGCISVCLGVGVLVAGAYLYTVVDETIFLLIAVVGLIDLLMAMVLRNYTKRVTPKEDTSC